jgi:hypothetical protein
MNSGKLPPSPWAAQVHGSTYSNPWAYGPHGMTIVRDIPLSHYNCPMSVWLSHFLSSHVRMGYPTGSNMSQTVRGPVSIKILPYCPTSTTLPPYHPTTLLHPTTLPPYHPTTLSSYHPTNLPTCCPTAILPYHYTTLPLYCSTALLPNTLLSYCKYTALLPSY